MYHDIATVMKQAPTKILYLVTKSNMGGAQRYVFDLATRLSPEAFDVAVAFGNAQGSTGPGALSHTLSSANIRTVYVPTLTRDVSSSEWKTFKDIYRLLKVEHPDVVHLNSSKAAGIGSLAARLCGIKNIIFTVHGWPFRENRNPLARGLIYFFSYLTVLFSHKTICICDFDAHAFDGFPFVNKKISLIRNGIVAEELLMSRDSLRSHLNTPAQANDIWIASIGELNKNKNISLGLDVMATALKTEPRLFYVVIGDGEDHSILKQKAYSLGIEHRVCFTGQLTDAAKYLSAFDILFIPSQKEGVPYVLLEAGCAKVAVVASRVGGIPEVINDSENGFIRDSNDIEGFADAIVTLAHDTEKRKAFGEALSKIVSAQYSQSVMIEKTTALYQR